MGAGKYILGGLLGGLGESLVLNGRAKREEALRVLELNMRQMENERDRTFRKGEADADRKARADEGAADRTFRATENEEDRALRFGEGERDRKARAGESAADREARLKESAADREVSRERLGLDKEEFEYKKTNGLLGGDNDLVEVYDSTSPTGTKYVTKAEAKGMPGKTGAKDASEASRADEQTRMDDAETQAIAEANEKAGMFRSDETDFGPEGRDAWIKKRTKEIFDGDTGKSATNGNSGATPSGQSKSVPPAKRPDKANKPRQYPDAKWSDKAGGWVVSRNGKWYVIEE